MLSSLLLLLSTLTIPPNAQVPTMTVPDAVPTQAATVPPPLTAAAAPTITAEHMVDKELLKKLNNSQRKKATKKIKKALRNEWKAARIATKSKEDYKERSLAPIIDTKPETKPVIIKLDAKPKFQIGDYVRVAADRQASQRIGETSRRHASIHWAGGFGISC